MLRSGGLLAVGSMLQERITASQSYRSKPQQELVVFNSMGELRGAKMSIVSCKLARWGLSRADKVVNKESTEMTVKSFQRTMFLKFQFVVGLTRK